MARFVSGDVIVVPFPFTDLSSSKVRPALVLAALTRGDLILCQITSQSRHDGYSISLFAEDFERGHLSVDSFIRPNRLFTVDQSVILYTAAKVRAAKLNEVRARIRSLFA